MPRVSVIMPCLNVHKYIRECIESVLVQTISEVEILVIDAGSTDGTVEILEEYARKDKRITLLHSDKRSYGYQINLGISMSRGEWIGIVETDDIIVPDMYQKLYEAAIVNDVDYVKGAAEGFFEIPGGSYSYRIAPFTTEDERTGKVLCPSEVPELFWRDNFLWYGLYKKEFLQRIKLNETPGAAFQDIGALFQIVSSAKKAVYLSDVVYRYRQDNMEASSYNRKCFQYMLTEYNGIFPLVSKLDAGWKKIYYKKMFLLCLDRFRTMAASGSYWKESEAAIEQLRISLEQAFVDGWLYQEDFAESDSEKLSLFMQNSEELYYACRKELEEGWKQIENIMAYVKKEDVIIFGSGMYGKFLHAQLVVRGMEKIRAFCDSNEQKRESRIQNLEILAVDSACRQYPDAYYIVAGKYHREMKQQLLGAGISGDRILCYFGGTDIRLFTMQE